MHSVLSKIGLIRVCREVSDLADLSKGSHRHFQCTNHQSGWLGPCKSCTIQASTIGDSVVIAHCAPEECLIRGAEEVSYFQQTMGRVPIGIICEPTINVVVGALSTMQDSTIGDNVAIAQVR